MLTKKNILSKLILSSLLASGLAIGGNAAAANIKIYNHTSNDMHVICTGGQCTKLNDFKDLNIPRLTEHLSAVGEDFTAEFSTITNDGQCNFVAREGQGILAVDLMEKGGPGCAGIKFTSNNHQDTSDPKGVIELHIETIKN